MNWIYLGKYLRILIYVFQSQGYSIPIEKPSPKLEAFTLQTFVTIKTIFHNLIQPTKGKNGSEKDNQ